MADIDKIKTIPLDSLIDVANKYISGEWDEKTIAEYGETMQIRAYVPLLEKTSAIINILNKHLIDSGMVEFAITDMQKDLFFYGLLQTYALVDCSNEMLVTYENYDLLYPLFYPFITSYCKEDFEQMKEMLKDSLNLSNVRQTISALADIDVNALNKTVEANSNMFNTFKSNKDIIEKLNNIAIMNDPTTAKVVEELKKMAVESVNQPDKNTNVN